LPEVVRESGGGFTYRTDGELLEAMESLRLNPDLRAALGELGNQGYRERWSPDAHLRAYFEIIEEGASKRGAGLSAVAMATKGEVRG
jgi:hypothetical protein